MTLPSHTTRNVDLFIDGAWTGGASDKWLENRNPATLDVIGRVAVATEADLERAARANLGDELEGLVRALTDKLQAVNAELRQTG